MGRSWLKLSAIGYPGSAFALAVRGEGRNSVKATTDLANLLRWPCDVGWATRHRVAICPGPLRSGLPHVLSVTAVAGRSTGFDWPSSITWNPGGVPLSAAPPIGIRATMGRQRGRLSGYRRRERSVATFALLLLAY